MNEEQLSKLISTVDSMVNLTIKIPNSRTNSPTPISPSSSAYYSTHQSPDTSPSFDFSYLAAKDSVLNTCPKLRTCDVYIGFHGQNQNLIRFCKWVKSELEIQGVSCFLADRSNYADSQSHEVADRVICSVTFGIIVVTKYSLFNYLTNEEIRFFGQKKNLIPVLFETSLNEVTDILAKIADGKTKDCKEAMEFLIKCHNFKLEASNGNWRSCVMKAVGILRGKFGRKSVADKEIENLDEIPFCKNRFFVGREKEIAEMEALFFGSRDLEERNEEVLTGSKYKKSNSVVCVNGGPGMGKTELALEFAYRYLQRYKMVIWVGGEGKYLRQNLLNSCLNLGLDLSADGEKERGRIRSFDEQETEAFKRIKQALFREMPYLLIVDNLETEKDWWEGKDLHDLIPRNTGSTHVIITTRLHKVMSFKTMRLQPLPSSDAMMLITGRRKKAYPDQEVEVLKKIDEKLGRSSFGLSVIGSLLCEITILPSDLFQAIDQILDETTSWFDEPFWVNNRFLLKVLIFCVNLLNETKNDLALRMLLTGVWFAQSPVSSNLLAAAASHMSPPTNKFKKWAKNANLTLFSCSGLTNSQSCKTYQHSALVLVNLGLAKRTNTKPGCCLMFHPITQVFAKQKGGLLAAQAAIQTTRKIGNTTLNSNHLWASAFLVFGFKSTPPLVQLNPLQTIQFIKKTALPLSITAFTTFSRCNAALELLKISTNVLEEVENSFVSQVEDPGHGSLYWKKKKKSNLNQNLDEYVWQDVTLLKATLLETRAKLLLRGGYFDHGEELCRTCIGIRTVMLGHNHAQTLAAQETLSKLIRLRCKV